MIYNTISEFVEGAMIERKKVRKHTVLLWVWLFFLLPFPGSIASAAWKFAVISDTQGNNKDGNSETCVNDEAVQAIAENIVQENPDFVLVSGDLVNGWFKNGGVGFSEQYANWKKSMDLVYRSGIKIYPIRGNHDSGPERLALPPLPQKHEPPPGALEQLAKAFRAAFGKYVPKNGPEAEKGLTYSFKHKNAFIIGLDQYTKGQHKINQAWLDSQLAKAGNRHIFVYGHEPAFETGHKDNLAFFPKERDQLWESLGKAGARVYFCGHDHFYNRARIPDNKGHEIRQIIEGTGGGAFKSWTSAYRDQRVLNEYYDADHYGYMLITVMGSHAAVAWKALLKDNAKTAWKILDSFEYDKAAEKVH